MNEGKITIKNVRIAYAHVWAPEASLSDPGKKKYSCVLIIPKDHPQVNAIKATIKAAAQAGIATLGGKITAGMRNPLRDGDTDKPDSKDFEGMYFMTASSNKQPGIGKPRRGSDGKPLRDEHGDLIVDAIKDESEVYSGCWCHVSVNFFCYNQAGNKGVACGLNNILKFKDGDFMGGCASLQSDFGGSISDDDLADDSLSDDDFPE